ncbi:MAG: type II toxin-antitoxin system HicB family antitoxin [Thermodesulfobacteriota bacterium]|nr:type II toxin-antitoxin system HicB family antitoxin [Thermodesulfobacteriota bacterium]
MDKILYIRLKELSIIKGGLLNFTTYTANYTKTVSGYMGQLIEWPEVVTEGKDIEECRDMLRDAFNEMILAYQQHGKELPLGNYLI